MEKKDFIGCGVAVILAALMIIFGTTIVFGLGCLGGLLLNCFVGQPVANGLNMVLGNIMQHNFTPDDIPLFCGIMTTIGGFFKTSISTSKKD